MKRMIVIMATLMSLPVGNIGGQTYQVIDLGNGDAYGINDNRQVVGINDSGAFLWSNGSIQNLCPGIAYGINASGQVVGSSGGSAFLWSNGSMQNLGMRAAYAINNSGNVVGDPYPGAFPGSYGPAVGYAINNIGQSVGQANRATGGNDAFINSGGMQDLVTLGAVLGYGPGSCALGINDNGQVVGWGATYNGSDHAFSYSLSGGGMKDLGTLHGGTYSQASAINNAGQIVGNSGLAIGGSHAFIYSDGVMQDLNNLIAPGSGWTLQVATDINELGDIVGWGMNSSGQTEAFLLEASEVPEPTILLPLGLVALILRRQR